ncbi:MAG: HU family DNA-binding protein [Cyanobacteriota bacterium]|nr:HU family DNA-binding protein [Cyanobacteriota bacterium]
MNKTELVTEIAARAGVTKQKADTVLASIVEVIMETVAEDEKVVLIGFGSFEARDRSARTGRNPATGEPLEIPATKVPAFSPGKAFKQKVSTK